MKIPRILNVMGSKEYVFAVLTTGRQNLFKRKLRFNVLEEISSAGGLLRKLTYTSPIRSLLSNKSTHISPIKSHIPNRSTHTSPVRSFLSNIFFTPCLSKTLFVKLQSGFRIFLISRPMILLRVGNRSFYMFYEQ